jgi:glycosyltransferase involved in cell wall biosynthesis
MANNLSIVVIIPLYNAGDYIVQCIESILGQQYENYVIRIVDDGSKDHSSDLCAGYAAKYPDKIYYQKISNGGANNARNKALRESSEDLVFFVDQDDFLACDDCFTFLNKHFQACPTDDFIIFKYREYFTKSNIYKERPDFANTATVGEGVEVKLRSFVVQGNIPISPWDKVFKRRFLLDKNIFLPVGFVAGDINWFIEIINKVNTFSVTNKVLYIYRRQVAASLTNAKFNIKKYEDLLSIIEREVELLEKQDDSPIRQLFFSFLAYEMSILLAMSKNLNQQQRHHYSERVKKLNWLYQFDANPKVKKVNILRRLLGDRLSAVILNKYIQVLVNKNIAA